ncbi:hypothetical protein NEIMUCOT_05436 [Neisseria mucosa ATCC 25996]|uniref:Uncharacterized protein n=1 Tax=Neisseria mucosa (strain ATCC 25996 / DSM 4631 / NCTC 10774 / M26) TaxID=546266 RepID=D2ZXT2_NEIM2|nr:hypothetical protein NEIMUCOT_05436 [Neisseria mucosa ATCC 25996]
MKFLYFMGKWTSSSFLSVENIEYLLHRYWFGQPESDICFISSN